MNSNKSEDGAFSAEVFDAYYTKVEAIAKEASGKDHDDRWEVICTRVEEYLDGNADRIAKVLGCTSSPEAWENNTTAADTDGERAWHAMTTDVDMRTQGNR